MQLSRQGDWDWRLLEYERRATTPKRVAERLRPYQRYFESGYARRDHGGACPLVLFVFESAEAEGTFVEVAARLDQLDHAPVVSTHTEVLIEQGVLDKSGHLRPPQPAYPPVLCGPSFAGGARPSTSWLSSTSSTCETRSPGSVKDASVRKSRGVTGSPAAPALERASASIDKTRRHVKQPSLGRSSPR